MTLPLDSMVRLSLLPNVQVVVLGPVMLPEPGHCWASAGLATIIVKVLSTAADTAWRGALTPTVALRLPRRFAVSGATRPALCGYEETME
jgi:hypothetical protein